MLVLCGVANAGEEATAPSYRDTAFGWYPYMLPGEHTRGLRKSMREHEQQVRRYRGVPTDTRVMTSRTAGYTMGGWEWMPAQPQHFMPYLDSLFVPGNTCVEPSWWVQDDMLSTGAQ